MRAPSSLTPRLAFKLMLFCTLAVSALQASPNVILIMTDDQGYGDFGIHGNALINTPHLDQLARESASMSDFYVSPVCSPTRANLMTGRYNYRTGVVDTFKGRSMMHPDETTIAEVLADAGYATGIFGKWHLGDNYPLRASDQGFQETYLHRGGGLAQPSEPIENKRRYTNPILFHNNQAIETHGYCTDLYFEAASHFINKSVDQEKPFFAYIATNAPHSPFHDVPEALYQKYRAMDLSPIMRDKDGDQDTVARIFAMIENIDENMGRLLDQLDRRNITRDTIVIYLNDNGPNGDRFTGPFRGQKNRVFEGGIRSPLWVRWPARLSAGTVSDRVAAHYDLMPTILAATGVATPANLELDGRSLLALLEGKSPRWLDRDIFIQAHRGDAPIAGHNMAMRSQNWKLLRHTGFHNDHPDPSVPFELYDMSVDQGETNNLAEKRPEIVTAMRKRYQTWFADVSSTRPDNYAPPRMHLGDGRNNQLTLSWQNRREIDNGFEWHVATDVSGDYQIELEWAEPTGQKEVKLSIGSHAFSVKIAEGTMRYKSETLTLPAAPHNLKMSVTPNKRTDPPYFVHLKKL
ncbi:MAG: arylsulfatase [Synoicihabitans sp.]